MSWRWLFIFLFFAGAAGLELWPLWKKKRFREAGVYTLLLLFGTVLHILLLHHIVFPSPVDAMFRVLEPVEEGLNRLLGL